MSKGWDYSRFNNLESDPSTSDDNEQKQAEPAERSGRAPVRSLTQRLSESWGAPVHVSGNILPRGQPSDPTPTGKQWWQKDRIGMDEILHQFSKPPPPQFAHMPEAHGFASPELRKLCSVAPLHKQWPTPERELGEAACGTCSKKLSNLRSNRNIFNFPKALYHDKKNFNVLYPLRVAGLSIKEFATLYDKELTPQDAKPIPIIDDYRDESYVATAEHAGHELQFSQSALKFCGLAHRFEASSIDLEISNYLSYMFEIPVLVRTLDVVLDGEYSEPQTVVVSSIGSCSECGRTMIL